MAEKPTEKAAVKEKVAPITQHGVKKPNADTQTGRVWAIADELSRSTGQPATRKDVLEKTTEAGINVSTAATQYGQWRKFNGLGKEETASKKVVVEKKEKVVKPKPPVVEEDPGEEESEEEEFDEDEGVE